MPGGDFLILMLLLWTFIGRGTDAERVTGVLHGQVELCRHHRHSPNVTRIEWAKYVNGSPKRLIYTYAQTNNTTCFSETCQRMYFDLQNMSLIINNLTVKDEGIYEETTVFINGSKATFNITLSLLFPSKITVSSSDGTLTLTCEVRGEFVLLRWMRDGLPLPVDQRFSLGEMNKTLQVSNLTSLDCATYTCHVSNENGASHEAHLTINDNITKVCQNKSAITILILVGVALLIVLPFVCICGFCIYKYGCCRTNPPDRSKRVANKTDIINMEEPIYNEPSFVQEAATQNVNVLPYVYSTFIKPAAPLQTDQAEDFGYSTFAEVYENDMTQPPQTT